ncbi:ABC transporter ATP-binding protein [Actinotalea sp.]|uniref:ABC transporter ATP-binding protein n=1 Tax=Actinotalea sp. TaxID=1872145 RepID=UPI0035663D37
MIQAEHLSKRYGATTAVDDVSFTVRPGQVTGFLGPNGAGKSTTMRMIVGLDRPTAGHVTVNGSAYAQHQAPLHEVGALLEAKSVHPGRSAYQHLRALGATHGIGARRVEEVIALAGLESVARKRVGGFSLGMGQRLGIAAALLGDPHTVMLDEPVNGLDPEGVKWVRTLVRHLAGEGRTVFLSSHLMSEMALTADHVIVLGRGRIIADAPIQELIDRASHGAVTVRTPQAEQLAGLLQRSGATVHSAEAGVLEVVGRTAEEVGEAAAGSGIVLHQLVTQQSSLEEAYLQLTADEVEYHSGPVDASPTPSGATAPLTGSTVR